MDVNITDVRFVNTTRVDFAGDDGALEYTIAITSLDGNVTLSFQTSRERDECIKRLAKQFSALAA